MVDVPADRVGAPSKPTAAPQPEPTPEPARERSPGLVGVPTHPWLFAEAAASIMGLDLPPGARIQLDYSGNTIARKRNNLVRSMLAEPRYEWLAFVDSDMVVPPYALKALLDRQVPIVGALYCGRSRGHTLEAAFVESTTEGVDPLRPTDGPGFSARTLQHDDPPPGADGVRVDCIGMGCTVIRREVFEAVDEPWFLGNHRRNDADCGEDWNFCMRAGDAGYDTVVDLEITAKHLDVAGYTP